MKRSQKRLGIFIVVIFLSAWLGELLTDVGVIEGLDPGFFFTIALPVIFNLLILSLWFEGEFSFAETKITKKHNPTSFYSISIFIWVIVNLVFILSWKSNS